MPGPNRDQRGPRRRGLRADTGRELGLRLCLKRLDGVRPTPSKNPELSIPARQTPLRTTSFKWRAAHSWSASNACPSVACGWSARLRRDEDSLLIQRLGSLATRRVPITIELLQGAWALRDNVAGRDALHLAAARGLTARLTTADERLARAVPDLVAPLD